MSVVVVTDSASSLPQEDLERLHIKVASLYVNEGSTSQRETEIALPAFYERLQDVSSLPTTSQPSPQDFSDVFTEAVEAGHDVCCVLLSSKMSSTYATAEIEVKLMREQYPDARIELVDSESNSMQEGFAVLAAAECAAEGGSLAECAAAARATIPRTRFLFAPYSLEYLSRGGRISGATALLGSALQIAPILTALDGTTGIAGKVRTYSKALLRMAKMMRTDVARCGLKRAAVQAISDIEGGRRFAHELIEPIVGSSVPVVPIAATIGLHVGPAIGVTYETIDPLREG